VVLPVTLAFRAAGKKPVALSIAPIAPTGNAFLHRGIRDPETGPQADVHKKRYPNVPPAAKIYL
jgi:hypothetical protein